ncbi:MAG TPA: type I polyketide synthase, partial [Streptosporangiaceae bacterium]|nr:type I polyketide synthase [Streptosporangiaceae bacterium]
RFALIDIDQDPRSGPAVYAALTNEESQIVIREGAPRVLRLSRPEPGEFPDPGRLFDPEGTVLITGGTGTLGARLARHLVAEHGARRLLLASRRGMAAAGAARLAAGLSELAAEVTITACDAADADALAGLFASIADDHPLTAVVHLAGVLDDATIGRLTAEQLDFVLRPKLDAAWNLHTLSKDLDLSAFILFASIAGVIGTPGQGNYAAANTFLDALAEHRHALGLPATSLDWGYWAQVSGMTSQLSQADLVRLSRSGIAAIDTEQALTLFGPAVASDHPVLVPARLDTAGLRSRAEAGLLPGVFRDLIRVPARQTAGQVAASQVVAGQAVQGLAERLAGLSGAERDAVVGDLVRTAAATVLGHTSADAVEPGRAFREMGFDSLTAVELRNQLSATTGLRLPVSLLFDYPSPEVLAGHLIRLLVPGRAVAGATAMGPASAADVDLDPVAVVGIGCRFPGGAGSAEELWGLVAGGVDAVSEFPADRGWDTEGASYTRLGGFLYDAGDFDAGFFGISPREALAMDPQQRLLLECAWEAFEDAGIDPATVRGSLAGVFTGVMYHDYGSGSGELPEGLQGHLLTGAAGSVVSGRVAYVFGLEGPAVSLDTACSSSLVALHLAVQSLRRGECSLALAGGVTVMATPGTFIEFSRQGGLTADGRCKPFAAGADGTGWAEGAGLLLVERLSDAVRNGRRILGVVAGSAVNQDGASNGLTAPNGPSQERVIRAA